jgi:CheY-like chemotaxis protein
MQRRALIVDGEPAASQLLQEVLGSAGIEGVTTARAADADGHLQAQKFDVILVDLSMQASGGLDLTRRIRSSGINRMTPVIVIGDSRAQNSLTRGFEAGASFLIYKPIDRVRLMRLIRVTQGAIEHERRRFRRVPLRARARIKSAGAETEGETVDLSLNGTLIKAPRVFPAGSSVEVSLFLAAGTKPVVGLGSVQRVVGQDQMGICLDRFSIRETQRLQEYLLPHVMEGSGEKIKRA